jgi:hypothetical protein
MPVDLSATSIRTTPVGRGPALSRRVVGVLALALAVSVIRPWGDASPSGPVEGSDPGVRPGPREGVPPPAVAAGAAAPTPGPGEIACTGAGTQLVSLDRLGPWTARTWVDAEPVPASGPLDPAIGEVVLASPAVLGVGMCLASPAPDRAPPGGAGGAAATLATGTTVDAAWIVADGRASPLEIERLGSPGDAPGVATLYRPAIAGASGSPAPPAATGRRRPPGAAGPPSELVPGGPAGSADPAGPAGPSRVWAPGRYVLRLAPDAAADAGLGGPGPTHGAALFITILIPARR